MRPSAAAVGPRTDGFSGHEEPEQDSPVRSGDSRGTGSSGHAVLDDDEETLGRSDLRASSTGEGGPTLPGAVAHVNPAANDQLRNHTKSQVLVTFT